MKRKRKGFLITDAMVGLALIVTVSAVAMVSLSQYHRAAGQLQDRRLAARHAEQVLVDLQLGRRVPLGAHDGFVVDIEALAAKAEGKHVWVRVTVTRGRQAVSLTGLAAPRSPDG
jgi:hypothetical protein